MSIVEIVTYAIVFGITYSAIDETINRVNKILERKLSSKVYDVLIHIMFVIAVCFLIYRVFIR